MFRRCSPLVALVVAAAASGCALDVPGVVDGHAGGAEFTIRDEAPELREQGEGEALLVLSDDVGGVLRLVQIEVPAGVALDEPLPVAGDDGIYVSATWGALVETTRSDGVTVQNAADFVTLVATGGTVTFSAREPVVAGQLEVTLEDGGALEGDFVIDR